MTVLLNIQALRAVAAFMVVALHAKAMFDLAGVNTDRLLFLSAGVDLFFVISGFVMVYTTQQRETKPWQFLVQRIARIVPLYWAVTFALFFMLLVAPSLMPGATPDVERLWKSLLFLPFERNGEIAKPTVFLGWTLNYEMFFYALFAVGLLAGRFGVALVICVLALLVSTPSDIPVLAFYTDPILMEFCAGMVLGLLYPRLRSVSPLALIVSGFALLGLSSLVDAHRALIWGLPSAMIVAGALMLERSGKSVPALKLMGDASYSLYLTHFFVTNGARKVLSVAGPSLPLAVVFVLTSLVLSAVVAVLVHRYVERPLTVAAKRFLTSGTSRVAGAH